jgi:opacity protein-like surface antigen
MARCGFACIPLKLTGNYFQGAAAALRRLQSCRMYGFVLFLAFFLFAAMAAAGQDSPNEISLLSPAGSGAPQAVFAGRAPPIWQLAGGYQFNYVNIRGAFPPIGTLGVSGSLVRYIIPKVGVEADAGGGWGANASVSSIFVGGGAHVVFPNRTHFEPWGHAVLGGAHFSFGAPDSARIATVAWIAGGGVDYRVSPSLAVRIQTDYLGTHFLGAFQRNFQVASSVVWNF